MSAKGQAGNIVGKFIYCHYGRTYIEHAWISRLTVRWLNKYIVLVNICGIICGAGVERFGCTLLHSM